ncbi:MAG: ATP-binding protein [Mailhella sp.]|nr:ATP-binding protein [Mailhella sp.]
MKYMRRDIDDFLTSWKADTQRKPLIVRGARQVGKTASIRNFAQKHYASVAEINFVEEPKYKGICSDGYSADAIIKNISLLDPSKKFEPGKTLIFFDELQEFPEIATSLKFFREDGRFDVICSGSMLGINYRRIESNSVGSKTDYVMRSLSFSEFLLARGYGASIEGILEHMTSGVPFSPAELSVFNALFLDYCVIGGMPAVVARHIDKGTFEGTLEIQRQLLADYREDVRKYASGLDQTRIQRVFDAIPYQLAKENKKFQISKLAYGARTRDYAGCIEWLSDAGIVNVCRCLNFPELPLKGNEDPSKYKLYMADTGLLVAMLDDEAQDDLRGNKNLGVYKGALYENMVGEALVKNGYGLAYYRREDSTLEEDFFVRTQNDLFPVEVKAGTGRAKSMQTLIASDKYADIRSGIKFFHGNIGRSSSVYSFPYFCAFLLRRFLQELRQ